MSDLRDTDYWRSRADRMEAVCRNLAQVLELSAFESSPDNDFRAAQRRAYREQLSAHGFTLDSLTGMITDA